MIKVDGNVIVTKLPTKDITPAAYSQLSNAEKNNGTIYFVSDNPGTAEEVKLMYDGACIGTATKIQDITMQAYNQLSTAQKNNNTIYLITDYDYKSNILDKGLAFIGDTTTFAAYADGTLSGIIADIYDKLERIIFSSNVSRAADSNEFLSVSAINGLPIPSHPTVNMSDYGGTDPT